MKNPFIKSKVVDIYHKQNTLKVIGVLVAIIIGSISIYYTDILVGKLKQREKRYIDLFANTLTYAANEDNEGDLTFLSQEILVPNDAIPVILTNSDGEPVSSRNIDIKPSYSEAKKQEILKEELEIMKQEHEPVEIRLRNNEGEITDYQYVYYKNSYLLQQLKYYPYIQLSVIGVFALLAYLIFSYSKAAEQNRVWVGLAKETAHQLGTPLSSLMAWMEYFKADKDKYDHKVVEELEKDTKRLEMITSRFSSIGSVPVLKEENLYEVISDTVNYLQRRISSKVEIKLYQKDHCVKAKINKPLFDWVIENLIKNGVDAMGGSGTIYVNIFNAGDKKVIIDITDEGKGIPKSKMNQVFSPGFTTKKRGWGLGLTLVKRIIEIYHEGRIFVKASEVNLGTTIRIILFD